MAFEVAAAAISLLIALWIRGDSELSALILVPLIGAGALAIADVLRVFARKLGVLEVRSVLAVFLMVFVLVSPVSQLVWDYWPALPANSRSEGSIIFWAWSWFFGALAYRICMASGVNVSEPGVRHIVRWRNEKFLKWWSLLLIASLVAQGLIYAKFHGISGYVETVSSRSGGLIDGADPFEGLGPLVALADGSRYLLAIGFAYFGARVKGGASWGYFCASLLILACLLLVLGGLRGSRGVMIYGLFTYVVLYHFWVRRIGLVPAVIGCVLFFGFMSTYYYYKFYGLDGLLGFLQNSASFNDPVRVDANRYVLARDLGRMDMQVLAIQRAIFEDFPLSLGRSYLGAPFSIIPNTPLFSEPPSITKEKVEMLFGYGSFDMGGTRQTSLLLGQFGESVINFGVIGVLLFFSAWIWISKKCQTWIRAIDIGDGRAIFAPAVLLLPVQLVMYDSSLLVMFFFKLLLFPTALYFLIYRRSVLG